jgi:hypothetical protein
MGRSVLGELKDHWRELKAGSMHLPRRADLDASRIVGALPRSPILERALSSARRASGRRMRGAGFVGSKPQDIPSSALIGPGSWAGLSSD